MRKTMTILGDTGGIFPGVMKVLMEQDLRLLFVSEDEEKRSALMDLLAETEAVAEIEYTSCEREGCWEADIIVITQPERSTSTLLEKIKEVATQKIVVTIASEGRKNEVPPIGELLPLSKVVEVKVSETDNEVSFYSKDPEADREIQKLFKASGYHLK